VIDSNGARSNGLWQFNEASYPDSGRLITGNCAADIQQQVGYLKAHVSGQALNGTTGAEVASNFAASFERCQGCQAGGSQNAQRTANAATVQGWVASGSWPTSSAGITGSGGGGGGNVLTSTIVSGTCVLPLNIPVAGQFCLLSKSQARGVLGVLLMIAGGVLLLPGVLVLAAAGLERTGAGAAAGQAAAAVTPVGRAAGVARSGYRSGADRVIGQQEKKQAAAPSPVASPARAAPAAAAAAPGKVRSGGSQVSQDFYDRYMS
jgi:hypothetical protein